MVHRSCLTRRRLVASALATGVGVASRLLAEDMPAAARAAALGGAAETKLQYWYSEGSGIGSLLPALLDQFREAHPEISVEPRSYVLPPAAMQALQTTVAADEQPAVMQAVTQSLQAAMAADEPPSVAQVGYGLLRYAADLPHVPIADAAASDADASGFLAHFPDQVLALGQVDGVQHGLPFTVAGTHLLCNAELFRQAGVTQMPRTWNDVRQTARILTAKTGVVALSLPDSGDFWNLQALLESNGARLLIKEEGRYRTGIAAPQAIAAMQLYADMILDDQTALPTSWEQGVPVFLSGKIAMFMGGGGVALGAIQSGDFKLVAIRFPTFDEMPRRIPVAGHNHFIFATRPAEQEAAWAFLKFLNSPKSVTSWVENTGFLPPIKGLADDSRYLKPYFDKSAPLRIDLEQMPEMVPSVSWPGANRLEAAKALSNAREKIVTGVQEVAAAFGEAATTIDELIRG